MVKRTCPNGHIVKDNKATHCPQCGEVLSEAPKKKRWLILVIVLGILFLCVIVALFTDNADDELATSAPLPTATMELTSTPNPTATQKPTATPTSKPTLDLSACQIDAAFVADVTISDGTEVTPGEQIDKVWRIANTGTCSWSDLIVLTEVGVDTLGLVQEVPLSDVEPGETFEVAVQLIAPDEQGTYRSEWHLSYQGDSFGTPLFAEILVVEPTPTPSASDILQSYIDLINASGMNNYIDTVGYHNGDPQWIDVTVRDSWHYEPEQIRLEAAQVLWEVWAANFCPHDDCVDCCRITFYDLMGNDLGGSSWLAGSVIKLED